MHLAEPAPRYDPRRHRRRSIRLRHHDYAGGLYFVTVCTHDRELLFGDIVDGVMRLSTFGDIVREEWMRTGKLRAQVVFDAFVVMPNHVHGIIGITADGATTIDGMTPNGRGTMHRAPTTRRFGNPKAGTLSTVIGTFKAAVTRRTNAMRDTPGGRVWQRNYWERVLHGERELHIARCYICDNPLRWHLDRCHTDRLR
jgi:REP element-mobilizing transposase RayT